MLEFSDPAVRGTDPRSGMRGFSDMVHYCRQLGVRTMLVESGDRFARDRVVQETGSQGLAESSLEVICVDHVTQYTNPGCTGPLVRQMLGVWGRVGGGTSAGEVEPRPAEGRGVRDNLARGQALA